MIELLLLFGVAVLVAANGFFVAHPETPES